MSYKINPVKAVMKMYSDGGCGIQKVNDKCFGICSAFNNSNNNWGISRGCEEECKKLVNDMRFAKYGVGWCQHHAPNRPVAWVQVPSFFPDFFGKYGDVKK